MSLMIIGFCVRIYVSANGNDTFDVNLGLGYGYEQISNRERAPHQYKYH